MFVARVRREGSSRGFVAGGAQNCAGTRARRREDESRMITAARENATPSETSRMITATRVCIFTVTIATRSQCHSQCHSSALRRLLRASRAPRRSSRVVVVSVASKVSRRKSFPPRRSCDGVSVSMRDPPDCQSHRATLTPRRLSRRVRAAASLCRLGREDTLDALRALALRRLVRIIRGVWTRDGGFGGEGCGRKVRRSLRALPRSFPPRGPDGTPVRFRSRRDGA